MKTGDKLKVLPAIVILLGLSLSGCTGGTPMKGNYLARTEDKEEFGRIFREKLETADTPQKHRSIAESYRREAKDYRLLAKEHQRRKKVYQNYKEKRGVAAEFMVTHCQNLVNKFSGLADEMEILAQQHEMLAEKIAGQQKP